MIKHSVYLILLIYYYSIFPCLPLELLQNIGAYSLNKNSLSQTNKFFRAYLSKNNATLYSLSSHPLFRALLVDTSYILIKAALDNRQDIIKNILGNTTERNFGLYFPRYTMNKSMYLDFKEDCFDLPRICEFKSLGRDQHGIFCLDLYDKDKHLFIKKHLIIQPKHYFNKIYREGPWYFDRELYIKPFKIILHSLLVAVYSRNMNNIKQQLIKLKEDNYTFLLHALMIAGDQNNACSIETLLTHSYFQKSENLKAPLYTMALFGSTHLSHTTLFKALIQLNPFIFQDPEFYKNIKNYIQSNLKIKNKEAFIACFDHIYLL